MLFDRAGARLAGTLDVARPPVGWRDIWISDTVQGANPARALATDLPSVDRLVMAGHRRPLELVQTAVLWLHVLAVAVTAGLCLVLAI